mgnify:CR=1 FL=1
MCEFPRPLLGPSTYVTHSRARYAATVFETATVVWLPLSTGLSYWLDAYSLYAHLCHLCAGDGSLLTQLLQQAAEGPCLVWVLKQELNCCLN